jgi:hypothetical protein
MSALRNSNGILNFAPKRDGVLALGNPSADNAMLGYLAGALQGGNLGQSIGRGLAGFVAGTRLDEQRLAPAQTYAALAAAGVPDALARAAALNRDVMKAVAPAYFGPGHSETGAVSALNGAIGRLDEFMEPETPNAADAAHSVRPRESGDPEPEPVAPGFPAEARSRASSTRYARERTERLAQALRASGVGEDDIRALQETLGGAPVPDARKAAIGRGLDLVHSRLAELQARYPRGTAKAPPALLSPKAKATLDKLRRWSTDGSSAPP